MPSASDHPTPRRRARRQTAAATAPDGPLVGYLALADALVLAPVGLG
jgi:hypothetical protein